MEDAGSLSGLAMLGKTAAALVFIVAVILMAAWFFNRLNVQRGASGQRVLRVVSSAAVGQREKVVIVDVRGTWLVLGVGGGSVRKLHQLDAPPDQELPVRSEDTFAKRFGQALRQNLSGKQ